MIRKIGTTLIRHLIDDERVRQVDGKNQTYYPVIEVLTALTDSANPRDEWDQIKCAGPLPRSCLVQTLVLGGPEPVEALTLAGVMRLIQIVDSPKAERLRAWMADVAARHTEEEANPELAVQRMRQGYEAKGYPRRWIDQRLHSISTRQELVSEWNRRGVTEGDQFSVLTNTLMQRVFGMDVNAYRQAKGAGGSLRDHLNDLELTLLSLAEATAASLHRHHGSLGTDQLMRDVEEAGTICRRHPPADCSGDGIGFDASTNAARCSSGLERVRWRRGTSGDSRNRQSTTRATPLGQPFALPNASKQLQG